MKRKLIVGIMLIILISLGLFRVQAYSGEIDPENYITLPSTIYITNGIGKGTISVSESGYNISYQKSDISASTFNSIANKDKEGQTYYANISKQITQKETNVTNLQTTYNNLKNSETATEEEIEIARTNYNTALEEYNTLVDTANSKMTQLKNELYALVPNYTSSWTKTTNSSNNVSIDFTGYSGTIYFILWVKIENGTNTYYEFEVYSNDIKKEETTVQGETQSGEWTDFSKAKITTEQLSDVRRYKFSISNVTPKSKHIYYYAVGDGTTTPSFSTDLKQLSYDDTKKVLYSSSEIAKYLELAKEQYVYVYEYYLNDDSKFVNKLVLNKIKLEKPAQKKYTDAFYATIISKLTNDLTCRTQILFNTPWHDDTIRKVHLRIGKISDETILRDIYNKKTNAFVNLLNYSKTATAFYDKTLNSNSTGAAGGITLEEQNALFDASNIINDEYYFLYAIVEDENGKYIPTEGVTIARASKTSGNKTDFQLNFYDSTNFTWKTFAGNGQQSDNTTAKETLPQTGVNTMVWIILGLALVVGGTFSYTQYKKNNF